MPKEMFFNISQEKREMIINAAVEEFTSKSFEQVSVNSIIKRAKISRGSFYTYFENLEELFNFIFSKIREERSYYAKDLIKEANGDYFIFIKKLFVYDYDAFSQKNRYSLFRNYIHYIQTSKNVSLKETIIQFMKYDFTKEKHEVSDIFDYEKYEIDESEFVDLVEMTLLIIINTFLKSESEKLNKEEVISLFNKRINILEYGTRKRGS